MGLGQNFGDIFSGLAEQDAANASEEELRKLKGLHFNERDYDEQSYLGDFNPEAYATPESAQYQTISEDPRVRGIQMDALQKLIDQSSGAADAKSDAARFGALDEANQLARGREQAIQMQAQRRGQGGNGMSSVMQAQAAQMAANRARGGTMQAVQDAALEKLAATQGAIGAAGNVRGQDFQRAAANSDIINRFNQFNTSARNAAMMGNVDNRNTAGMRNVNAKQGLSNSNTGIRNDSLNRNDRNKAGEHGAKMQRFGMERDINNQAAGGAGRIAQGVGGLGETVMGAAIGAAGGGGGGAGRAMKAARPAFEDEGEWI